MLDNKVLADWPAHGHTAEDAQCACLLQAGSAGEAVFLGEREGTCLLGSWMNGRIQHAVLSA